MHRTSLLSLLGRLLRRTAILALCLLAAMHVLAAVSMPILQAVGDGLQRARTVQFVASSEDAPGFRVR